ncbi:MAG TPA: site-specific integrase, partial [Flavobacteriales bacterium]|nr:site-specific integrase [Flavobacteriales bacterium]
QDGTSAGQQLVPGVARNGAAMPRTQAFDLLGYVPAEAHFKGTCYIDYYVRDPITRGKRRMRIKLNHVRGVAERKAYARSVCREVNDKLARGWNPLQESGATASWHTLDHVLTHYLSVKERDTNHSSPKTYGSFVRVFRNWCRARGLLEKAVSVFNRTHAIEFLDHLVEERRVGNITYNNYILRSSILFGWMIERSYRADNPFKGIKRKSKSEKFRTLITDEERRACLEWFQQHDPPMVLVCMFVFHTLLRPRSELLRIRVRDVDLRNGIVNVSGADSKGKRIRRPAIPDVMLPYLVAAGIDQAKPSDWLIGRDLRPGPIACGHNTTGNRWARMRDALAWPADKELYSLRDTGIVQLIADGVDLHYVMRQAGHRNIATTNIYVQHYFPAGIEAVRTKATAFKTFAP